MGNCLGLLSNKVTEYDYWRINANKYEYLPPYLCNASKISFEWLDYIAGVDDIFIRHARNVGELKIYYEGKPYYVDGFCEETNTVYEFNGDYWHGNPNIYDPDKMNYNAKKTFGQLYQNTLKKEYIIKSLGYNYVSIWESDWNQIKLDKSFNMKY